MSGLWGKNLRLSIFGESHGKAVGIVIDGLPSGMELDMDFIRWEMERRRAGKKKFATSRNEEDSFEILSGIFQGKTTGTPLCALINNTDRRSADYEKMRFIPRPGHADFTGYIKYHGFNDYRGGGHFSGRLTAPIVFAGAAAKEYLSQKGIVIGGFIKSIGDVEEEPFDPVHVDARSLLQVREKEFPALHEETGRKMVELISRAKEEGDSVGGVVETLVLNLPAGIGDPFFDSVESRLAQFLFSIPAVKGVEFGTGFGLARMKGSEANDPFCIEDGMVKTRSNHNGGILGGITNGMPLVFSTVFKPTPSIGRIQNSVDLEKNEETTIEISGRHDPCIVPRAVPVVEAAAALVLMDLILENNS